jgi:hypothetical protein
MVMVASSLKLCLWVSRPEHVIQIERSVHRINARYEQITVTTPRKRVSVHVDMVANIRAMTAAPRASSPCSARRERLGAVAVRRVVVVTRPRSRRIRKTAAAAPKNAVSRIARSGEWSPVAAAVLWAGAGIAWWVFDIDIPPAGTIPGPAVVT